MPLYQNIEKIVAAMREALWCDLKALPLYSSSCSLRAPLIKGYMHVLQDVCIGDSWYQYSLDTDHTEHIGVVSLHTGYNIIPGSTCVCCVCTRYQLETYQ